VIYLFPGDEDPIRQGDLFVGLPRIDISLKRVLVVAGGETTERSWPELASEGKPVSIIAGVRAVAAIVASQDCDALRAPDLTLCEVRPFHDVERKCKETNSAKGWKNIITQQARVNQKWFYLPPDRAVGFDCKMAVDFLVTLRVPRSELEELRYLRKGRLNEVAGAHFRERIAEFYRRYPYDEWYPLDAAELETYRKDYSDAQPYPYQSQVSPPESPGV
jgi:hypothetical protein